jgi:hypothetical protein
MLLAGAKDAMRLMDITEVPLFNTLHELYDLCTSSTTELTGFAPSRAWLLV